MHKNGKNYLKFGYNMHYGHSNHFLKFCQKIWFFGQNLIHIFQKLGWKCYKMYRKIKNYLKFGHNMKYGDTNHFLVFAKKYLLFGQR